MELRFGTWNVRSLYETAEAKNLVNEISKNKIHILAIQETRWNGLRGDKMTGEIEGL